MDNNSKRIKNDEKCMAEGGIKVNDIELEDTQLNTIPVVETERQLVPGENETQFKDDEKNVSEPIGM